MSNPDQYVYHENVSKNNNGPFKKIHVKKKVVPIYACPEVGERSPVNILDKYISKLPSYAIEHDLFYLRPLQAVPADQKAPWYASVPVGRDTLQKKFHLMCEQAGIKGNKTNHSLRATGATELYESGVPEKLIQERTGHRSLEALRVYERMFNNTKQYLQYFQHQYSLHTPIRCVHLVLQLQMFIEVNPVTLMVLLILLLD